MILIEKAPLKQVPAAAPPLPADPLVPTLFHNAWWLDITTRGAWDTAEVSENNRVVGRLPYYLLHNFGLTRGVMPPLTHFLGPAIADGEGSPAAQSVRRLAIMQELIRKLPRAYSYNFKCHRGVTDVIAFQREKFRTSVQFTHEIYPHPADEIWRNLHHKRCAAITRAQKQLTTSIITDPEEFMRFNTKNLETRAIENRFSTDICRKLIETGLARECGRIIAARDNKGDLVAAIFCVWDHTSCYFLMGTRQRDSYKGSLSLLVWEAIQDAVRRNLIFDLDGLSSDESVSFYSGFGATVAPRYIATRQSKMMQIIRTAQSLFREPNYYC